MADRKAISFTDSEVDDFRRILNRTANNVEYGTLYPSKRRIRENPEPREHLPP